ncbi:MAG: hypothetical protein LBI84_01620 [Propionibacteriaceae bacterium]|jgi:predicted metal-dependent peptidase|nr:hypothetical protein [Propionibacteriaceae bacterium]
MARSKTKADPAQAAREEGWLVATRHPVLRDLARGVRLTPDPALGAEPNGWARVSVAVTGWGPRYEVRHHPSRRASPQEWAWAFAHCLLHLGLNHDDPASSGGLARDQAHQLAACMAVNRLLAALRVGQAPFPPPDYPAGDETQLARAWRRDGAPAEVAGGGVAGSGPDLIGDQVERDSPTGRLRASELATGLARAVAAAVDRAGGVVPESGGQEGKQPWDLAMGWFASSFPLIGGLAAGFRIVADADLSRRNQISVAAVDPALAEIYVNPLAGLNPAEWIFVLGHEMLHAGLRHGSRALGRQPYLWNVAADFVVNGWLVELGVGQLPSGALHDPALQGLSAEAVYERIANDARRFRKLATLRGVSVSDILSEPLPRPDERFEAIDLDEFYRRALTTGLAYHESSGRGLLPAHLAEEIRVLDQPPIAWDVALARWFEAYVRSPESVRSYAKPSRRQAGSPGVPRPGRYYPETARLECVFGVVLDTSGSMSRELLGKALGAIAAYAQAKDVPAARVVFCDAAVHDAGFLPVEDIAGRVKVHGRGGTVLQPAINHLERAPDFPADGPILIITDGQCDRLTTARPHAYLIPAAAALPFTPSGPVFRVV